MEQKLNLKDYFELAKRNGMVHSQSQFAKLLNTDASTMSICLKGGNKKYVTTTETLISRAWIALMQAGVSIEDAEKRKNNTYCTRSIPVALCKKRGEKTEKACATDDPAELKSILKQYDETIIRYENMIHRQQREIDGLYERIDELKELIASLKKENAPTTIAHTA